MKSHRSIIAKLADAKLDNLTKPTQEEPERMETEQHNVSLTDELHTATESDAPKTRDPRRRKKTKKVTIQTPPIAVPSTSRAPVAPIPAPRTRAVDTSEAQTDTDAPDTDDGFRTVQPKRTKRNTRKKSGSDSDRGNSTAKQKKEKLERLKNLEVPRTFVIRVDEEKDKNEAKKTLWSEILKKTDTPQIGSTRVTTKGDIKITVGDDKTYQVLKDIAKVREDFDISDRKLPMVMIHDVDVSLTTDEIPIYLARKKPELRTQCRGSSGKRQTIVQERSKRPRHHLMGMPGATENSCQTNELSRFHWNAKVQDQGILWVCPMFCMPEVRTQGSALQ